MHPNLEDGIVLRLCPFCGRAPATSKCGEDGKGLMIECVTDGCVKPHVSYYDHQSAARAWNRRSLSGGK